MKHYKLEEHSKECNLKKNHKFWGTETTLREFCESNPENFLFYFNNEFILTTFYHCLQGFDRLEFKLSLLKQLNLKEKKYYDIDRSVKYDEELLKKAICNFNTKTSINIINYTYFDNAGKQYCFVSRQKFIESYFTQDGLDKEFAKTCEYLTNIGLSEEIKQAKRLYEMNKIYINFSELETIKQTESLIKQLNKKTKNY